MERLLAGAVAFALLALLAPPVDAKTPADCERKHAPQRAQEGKDVIWVPTADAMVVRMLEMADVTPADIVYDLGAGDGKIPIAAAKRYGATAVGVEYEANLVKLARCLVEAEGLRRRVEVVQGDIFATDFSRATVVTLYLLPALNLRLRPTLLAMKPGTRVVSYSFTMGDWEPDDHVDTDEGSAYLWVVPATAAGTWTFRPANGADAFEVTLAQTFQELTGSAGNAPITGKLAGTSIELVVRDGGAATQISGIVAGDRITGTLTRDGEAADYIAIRH
jgi:SAM-dependent methyltransferase